MDVTEKAKRQALERIGQKVKLATIPLGKLVKPPQFPAPSINPQLLEAIKGYNEAIAPMIAAQREIAHRFSIVGSSGWTEFWERLEQDEKHCKRLVRIGWLPHASSPFDAIDKSDDDDETDAIVVRHYAEGWVAIADELNEQMAGALVDSEAKATFAEVLAAHGAGLYRMAARVLYPEIERLSREIINGGTLKGITSQRKLREKIGDLSPSEMSSPGIIGLRLYDKLEDHLYTQVDRPDLVEQARLDPVPNRHAAIHGLVSYTSLKSSLNAIIIADYLFHAMSTIKRLSIEDAEPTGAE